MAATSKHQGDVSNWIQNIIKSIETPQQAVTVHRLIRNFETMYFSRNDSHQIIIWQSKMLRNLLNWRLTELAELAVAEENLPNSNNMNYNAYGNPINTVLDEISIGDTVEYVDAKTGQIGKRKGTIHIILQGVWDGEKVQFNDKDKTLVRSKEWLRLASKCQKCNRSF